MSVTIGMAMAAALADIAVGKVNPLTKRVTRDMLDGYLKDGWEIHEDDGRTIVLIWAKERMPP